MNKIKYFKENRKSPWVCLVGKNSTIMFAYPSLFKALIKFPLLAWSFKHHG